MFVASLAVDLQTTRGAGMIVKTRCRPLLLLSALFFGSCGGQDAGPFSGRYLGTQDGFFGAGTLDLKLSQSGSEVTGTWSEVIPAGPSSGQLSGTITGDTLDACLNDDAGRCTNQLFGQIVGTGAIGTTISGSKVYVPRGGLSNQFSVTKQ